MLFRITTLEKSERFDSLYKRGSTADIFLETFDFFLDKIFHKTALKPVIVKGFYLSERQMIIVFVGLRKGNCRNVIGEILHLF